jgi:hypothetical protein
VKKILILGLCFLIASLAFGQNRSGTARTVEVTGEAQVINGDMPAAKILAETRAKWAAMEQATQVVVSVDTIVRNAEMFDESVKSQITGSVTAFQILDEGLDNGNYWMTAKATVEPEAAAEVLQRDTTIAVYLPMKKIDGTVVENHAFSEEVVNQLVSKGFDVVDMAMDPEISKQLLEALKANNMSRVREVVSRYTAGSALIGELSVLDKGKNVGYATITFSIVDGTLPYRIISDGKVMKSGTLAGRGQGATDETAAVALSASMAKRDGVILASEVATRILSANTKSVRIELVGNTELNKYQELRDVVKNISWVLSLQEVDTKTMIVNYPEKTMYLATIIGQSGYKIRSFTDNEILVYPR